MWPVAPLAACQSHHHHLAALLVTLPVNAVLPNQGNTMENVAQEPKVD